MITTIGQLREQLPNDIVIDYVRYAGTDVKDVPGLYIEDVASNYFAMEFIKIGPYRYENEIRAVFYSKEQQDGEGIKVDLNKMNNQISISPFAKPDQVEETRKQLLKVFDKSKFGSK